MIVILTRWLIITVAILLCSALIPGIHVDSMLTAFLAAGLLGVINVIIKPVLFVLTLPLNLLTLGLFSFVINAFLLKLVDYFVTGFRVDGFWDALLGALVISLVNWLANHFIVRTKKTPDRPDKPDYIDLEQKGSGKWE